MSELHQLSKSYARLMDQQAGLYERYARQHGLNFKCLSVLMWIYYSPTGVTQNWISKQTYSSKQVINATIKKFQDKGFLLFEENPDDKRHKRIRLTKEGQEFASQVLAPLERAEQQALSRLSRTDQEALLRLSQIYSQELTKIVLEGGSDD